MAESTLNLTETPGGMPNPPKPPAVVTIPAKLCNLPPMNTTANRVLQLTSDPDVDMRDLCKVMELDPAFGGDILYLANSWLFGFPSKVLSVRHAIFLLGLERIKALAVTSAMRSFLGKTNPALKQCWRHSAAAAIIAEEISPIFHTPADGAYTLGLMHDVGRLALLKAYPAECGKVLRKSFHNADEACQAEREEMTLDHCAVGAWLSKKWSLPPEFSNVCAHHHEAMGSGDPAFLQVSKLACCLADALGFAAVSYHQAPTEESIAAHLRGGMIPNGAELRSNVEARLLTFD